MRRKWRGLVVTTAALLGLAGCHKTDYLQPPPPKDELRQPPADDPRFAGPPNYPASMLNQDAMRKDKDDEDAPGRGPRAGAMRGQ